MYQLLRLVTVVVAVGMINGCMVMTVRDMGYDADEGYGIDAYVSIPVEIRALLADRVDGYSMPPVSRYGQDIYPVDRNDPFNLPSYVSSDFNGDGIYDYAYMFSCLSWDDEGWYLKTKMLVVVSTFDGYALSSDIVLGTVSGGHDTPVEEYWGIRLLKRGVHVVETRHNGTIRETSVTLENDGVYLGCIDPDERSVFYSRGTEVYEIMMDMGTVAKKRAVADSVRSNRIIKIGASVAAADSSNIK